jgi:DNA-binding CsgD family transcriptional regulator
VTPHWTRVEESPNPHKGCALVHRRAVVEGFAGPYGGPWATSIDLESAGQRVSGPSATALGCRRRSGRVPWDVALLAGSLRCHNPSVQVIGFSASARSSAIDGVRILSRVAGPDQVAELVCPGHRRELPFVLTCSPSSASSPLSGQQLRVLALLSLGMTVAEVAARLSLSERAVTKAKVAIFSKLGVQSQAQALANALAAGWLGPAAAPLPGCTCQPGNQHSSSSRRIAHPSRLAIVASRR